MAVLHTLESSFFSKLNSNAFSLQTNTFNPPTTQAKFEFAVSQSSIIQRCNLLDQLFSDCLARDASFILPALLENVFGTVSSPGWGIRSLSRVYHVREFDCIRLFLSPTRHLMRLVHSLCEDPHSRYEFPIACLPMSSQKIIADGGLPSFYLDKVIPSNLGGTRSSFTVSLNSFELFMFHFAHYLSNPVHQSASSNINSQNPPDSLYSTLVDDYLMYYVPAELQNSPPPFVFPSQSSAQSSPHNTLLRSNQWTTAHNETQSQGAAEIWPAQIVISIFCEFWLHSPINESSICFSTPLLPSAEQIRVVRIFIKHLHYFVNSSLVGGIADRTGYKRLLWPHIQKQVYLYIKQCIERWPLDSSFRLIIEVWLSLIQPWRYTNIMTRHGQREHIDNTKEVSNVWFHFISDNIPFYSGIFQAVLNRMLKMDLTSPKNALVLFRVTKILSLPNLLPLIQAGEEKLNSRPMLTLGQDFGKDNFSLMMSIETRDKVMQLTLAIAESYKNILALQQYKENASSINLSPFSRIWRLIFGSDQSEQLFAEQAVVLTHLKSSLENLSILYKLDPISLSLQDSTQSYTADNDEIDSSQELSPSDKLHIFNQMKIPKVTYTGNPDLLPIQSTEFKFLVRGLYQIAACINHKLGDYINHYYYMPGFCGRFFRKMFLSPATCVTYDKSPSGRRMKVVQHLPPRVGFRKLASRQAVLFLLLLYVLFNFMGVGIIGYVTFIFILFLMKCFIKALWNDENI